MIYFAVHYLGTQWLLQHGNLCLCRQTSVLAMPFIDGVLIIFFLACCSINNFDVLSYDNFVFMNKKHEVSDCSLLYVLSTGCGSPLSRPGRCACALSPQVLWRHSYNAAMCCHIRASLTGH